MLAGSVGLKVSKTPNSVSRVRRLFILAWYSPDQWESLAGQNLQPLDADAVPLVEVQVAFGKILADNTDQVHRPKKARGHGSMAGRTA